MTVDPRPERLARFLTVIISTWIKAETGVEHTVQAKPGEDGSWVVTADRVATGSRVSLTIRDGQSG